MDDSGYGYEPDVRGGAPDLPYKWLRVDEVVALFRQLGSEPSPTAGATVLRIYREQTHMREPSGTSILILGVMTVMTLILALIWAREFAIWPALALAWNVWQARKLQRQDLEIAPDLEELALEAGHALLKIERSGIKQRGLHSDRIKTATALQKAAPTEYAEAIGRLLSQAN